MKARDRGREEEEGQLNAQRRHARLAPYYTGFGIGFHGFLPFHRVSFVVPSLSLCLSFGSERVSGLILATTGPKQPRGQVGRGVRMALASGGARSVCGAEEGGGPVGQVLSHQSRR